MRKFACILLHKQQVAIDNSAMLRYNNRITATRLWGAAMKAYKTLLQSACEEYVVNKSRFLCYAAPVGTQEDALAFLEDIRRKHRDASHNCYAYIIGQNAGVMRYSDDGEPGGTAGMPIIEVMKARGVVDCVVVVTRYFGGVLLGAGGLVRAYSHSCALALNAAKVCEMHPTERWMFEVAYPLWDRVQYALQALPVRMQSTDFAASVNFSLLVKAADAPNVLAELTRMTDGRLESLLEDEIYAEWEEPAAPLEDE